MYPAVSKWTGRSTAALGDAETRLLAEALNPTPQRPVSGVGYPSFHVLVDGFEWRFASLREIDLVIDTLSQKHLPNVRSLAWWANRLPEGMMSWRHRQKITRALRSARSAFEKELASDSP